MIECMCVYTIYVSVYVYVCEAVMCCEVATNTSLKCFSMMHKRGWASKWEARVLVSRWELHVFVCSNTFSINISLKTDVEFNSSDFIFNYIFRYCARLLRFEVCTHNIKCLRLLFSICVCVRIWWIKISGIKHFRTVNYNAFQKLKLNVNVIRI